ncbi:hypothetical protein [Rhizobium sp. IMFF44]|uniref:hypothetical protein n=1 Tax=unclassified Rhizobium TaxID=2613769 RepID=UPI0035B8F37D
MIQLDFDICGISACVGDSDEGGGLNVDIVLTDAALEILVLEADAVVNNAL